MNKRNTTIQDIAKAAGVSTATVSRALSNPELLSQTKLLAVKEAIKHTGYRVNRNARNLRKQKAAAVLVLVPNLGNPFFSKILSGINKGFSGTDYSVLIADSESFDDKTKRIQNAFQDGQIDGLISLDGAFSENEVAEISYHLIDKPVVFACEWVENTDFSSIRSDNDSGARLAVQHLYNLGHRKITHISGPDSNILTKVRQAGFLSECKKLKLELTNENIIRGDFSIQAGYAAASQILSFSEKPTAITCASDEIAIGVISQLRKAGISVPNDISVVGFDDIEISNTYIPTLTTVRQDRFELGLSASQAMVKSLNNVKPQLSIYNKVIDVELVVRESTAPPLSTK